MSEAKHTPLPWVVEPEHEGGLAIFIHKEGHPIAECGMGFGEEDCANAALIVKSVNNYDSLRQSLSASESKLSGVTQLCISHQERADTAEEELAAARKALEEIAAIQDREFGGDWDEIEQARQIALAALSSKEPEGERR